MPRILMTICQYISEVRKKDTVYIVFNKKYNLAMTGKINIDHPFDLVDENETDNETRDKFLKFMKEKLPDVKLTEVFDYVPLGFVEWPYLGTIAIDVDIGSEEYKIITAKWGDPFKEELINGTTFLWLMKYEDAKKIYEERKELDKKDFELSDDFL